MPQSPKFALLYGLGVWVGLVLVSLVLLPLEGQEVHESLKLSAMVAVVLAFTVLYLRRTGTASVAEGLVVGLAWAVIAIVLDLVLYAVGAFNIGIGEYFADVASSYLVMPVVTTMAMGLLRRR